MLNAYRYAVTLKLPRSSNAATIQQYFESAFGPVLRGGYRLLLVVSQRQPGKRRVRKTLVPSSIPSPALTMEDLIRYAILLAVAFQC